MAATLLLRHLALMHVSLSIFVQYLLGQHVHQDGSSQ